MTRMTAIYARVSSEQQREENTIASQTASLIEFAQAHDLEVPKEWASRSFARSPATVGLLSGSCSSARVFAPRFFQAPPRGECCFTLALRYDFTSIKLSKGLSPPNCRTCSAHKENLRRSVNSLLLNKAMTSMRDSV